MADYIDAHKYSANHKDELTEDKVCGCFYCLNIFETTEIEEWCSDIMGTAVCPFCGVDTVIGESSGYPITLEFLQKMNDYWF